MKKNQELKNEWGKRATKALVGKKIIGCRYTTAKETEELGWGCAVIVLQLDDGTMVFPSSDDEGNEGGALFTTNKDLETIPVIYE
jgi:hypothetical protein